MEDYARAVVLGVVQALTEFLPISSSGHLLIAPRLMGEEVDSLTFDVGLHVGTMTAVIVYFRRYWVVIVRAGLRDAFAHRHRLDRWTPHARLGVWIVLGTIPAVVAGLLLDDFIEDELREPWVVGSMLIAFGVVLGVLDQRGSRERGLRDISSRSALLIGVAQAMALVPGVSRSGVTLAAGRGLGFGRVAAARFSFLLSAPVVISAATLRLAEALRTDEAIEWGPLLLGALVAGLVGLLVIRGLLTFLQLHTLRMFVWYRIGAGVALLAAVSVGVL